MKTNMHLVNQDSVGKTLVSRCWKNVVFVVDWSYRIKQFHSINKSGDLKDFFFLYF